jgi:hypothetical protein
MLTCMGMKIPYYKLPGDSDDECKCAWTRSRWSSPRWPFNAGTLTRAGTPGLRTSVRQAHARRAMGAM